MGAPFGGRFLYGENVALILAVRKRLTREENGTWL
jgi:hypothetical protein